MCFGAAAPSPPYRAAPARIQALVNDPSRQNRDWGDIFQILRHAGECAIAIDWELIIDYLTLFDLSHQLEDLVQAYGKTH
jgi:hypothetical protein